MKTRSYPYITRIVVLIGVVLVSTFLGEIKTSYAQPLLDILYSINGEGPGDWLGYSIASIDDVNGDDVSDFVIGAPGYHATPYPGHAYLVSGVDGSILITMSRNVGGDRFGYAVAPAGDINEDGFSDFIVSAPGHPLRSVYIYSGRDGSQLMEILGSTYSSDTWDTFGMAVSSAGDVNHDGVPDILIGSPYADPGGRKDAGIAYVISGANGNLLYKIEGQTAYDFLGISLSGLGDVDSDGFADFAVGAPVVPTDYFPMGRPGAVYVYSGANCSLLYRLDGENPDDEFGWSVADAGDVNGDDIQDVVVGIRPLFTGRTGKAYVFSGVDGNHLFTFNGESVDDWFGLSVGGGGDVNGDNQADILVGAPGADPTGLTDSGSLFVFSGGSGDLLFRTDGESQGYNLGYAVSTAGDINGDGGFEILVSGGGYLGPNGAPEAAGRVYVLSHHVPNHIPSDIVITAPLDPQQVSTGVYVQAAFTDLDIFDSHSALWDWGDGLVSTGLVDGRSVSGSHTYTVAGVYTINLTVTDNKGGSGKASYQHIVIYDPDGGYITGGGWIMSPAGAYTPNPALSGKATFGFNSKYHKGAKAPSGNTEFQLHVADMNFRSISYDWLVITGSRAQYKGVGTINGSGNFGFILTATDGTPDRFRIKIWDQATGEAIYDNQIDAIGDDPMTAIGGGSIVIHTKE